METADAFVFSKEPVNSFYRQSVSSIRGAHTLHFESIFIGQLFYHLRLDIQIILSKYGRYQFSIYVLV
jgi:hypothetical protein